MPFKKSQKIKGILVSIMLISVCASCGNTVPLQKMQVTEEGFQNPSIEFRPMPIMHKIDKGSVHGYKELGYGGVVTNVSFGNYLQNEEMWEDFRDLTEYTIDKLGLRMWIYDERGYPSGSAGGLVLKDNPDWQAKGIVCVTAVANETGLLIIEKPYGHDQCIMATAYKGTSLETLDYQTQTDLSDYLDKDGNLNWTAPTKDWVAVCIYSKNFFEGTHAAFNWTEIRRYIDLLNPKPVQKFIDVTYKAYYDRVGQYFGKGIEAFFTDEPSLLGTYFVDPPPVNPAQVDTIDEKIPLLTTVNYGSDLLKKFQAARGYDAVGSMPLLFGSSTLEAQQFRWDYYKTLSELVAQNYTGQIGKFCEDHNVAMSGHLLLEEDIYMHPVFEGNYLQIYKNMQYPGIDLLTSHPDKALNWACTTAKLASSAAHYDNRKHVMSEVSDAFDGKKGDVIGRIGAIAVQYALGVDTITSYYPVTQMSDEENRQFTDTIGRFGYMLNNGKHCARVAVYYPIEGIWTQTLPPTDLYNFNNSARMYSDTFKEISLQLLQNQIDFDYLDSNNLTGCKIIDGAIVTPSGERYTAFVLPQTPALESKTIDFLIRAANKGVKIIIQGTKKVITEKSSDTKTYSEKFDQLFNHKNTVICESTYDVVPAMETLQIRDIQLKNSDSSIIYQKKQYQDGYVYMIVNTSDNAKTLDVLFNETGKAVKIWDPYTGDVSDAAYDNSETLELTAVKVEAKQAVFITIAK